MSDQEEKNIEYAVEAAKKSAAALDEPADAGKPAETKAAASPAPAKARKKPVAPPRKGSSAIAWLALLLVVALAAGAAWVMLEMQRREVVLVDRVAELEATAGQKEANLEALGDRWQGELQAGLGALAGELKGESSSQVQSIAANAAMLEQQRAELAQQRAELARFSATDRDSWLLAEA